jgi:hypothetical protein
MLPEFTVDGAREAFRNGLNDFVAAFEKSRQGQNRHTKGAIEAAFRKMRAHIITLAPDMSEARKNFKFFDRLSSSYVRNGEAIIALAVKLIGSEAGAQNPERLKDQFARSGSSCNSKRVPIPPGFGASLQKIMDARGHGLEAACSNMQDMDPKTLRKLLSEQGVVHRITLNKAKEYMCGQSPV